MHIPTTTLIYLATVFGLLVIPRALQRFRLPAQLTCFIFGIAVATFYRAHSDDQVTVVVATLGIASLFLFAGLDVDIPELRRQFPRLAGHLAIRAVFLIALVWVAMRYWHMAWQPAALCGLAVFTPSTGFILDTLPTSGLEPAEQTEVSMNAIAGEIVAVLALLFVSQAGSTKTLLIAGGAVVLLILLTPFLFLALGKYVLPYAPGSEFSLLIMVGVICAVFTKNLGVHYLVGAFVAGLIARLLQNRMTTLVSKENLNAVRLFASFFIPFYFFHEGLDVPAAALAPRAILYGLLLSAVILPIRIAKNWLQARYFSHRTPKGALRVAVALTPTLIFTLVIAAILHESFHISDTLDGALLTYATITTILPSFILPRLASLPTAAEPLQSPMLDRPQQSTQPI
jgi:Kef-type K+ transport system membrane component KefB